MNKKTRQPYEARVKIAKAMAHSSRLLTLDLHQKEEVCVGDLTCEVGADQSSVSKHLAVLNDVGLIDVCKEGSLSFYRVMCGCLDGFIMCLESVLKTDVELRNSALK